MGKNARIKRIRREARQAEERRRQAIMDKVDNTNVEGLSKEEQEKVLKELRDNDESCEYMIAKALRNKQHHVVEAIRYYKATGKLNLYFATPEESQKIEAELSLNQNGEKEKEVVTEN